MNDSTESPTINATRVLALLAAIAVAAAMRLLPHPPNVSPIAAMALFSGAYLAHRGLAFVAPLAALFVSDLVLGFYPGMGFVYGSMALTVVVGWALSNRRTPVTIALAAITGSTLFYLITNFGMWLFSGFYPLTVEGLVACYVAAIPFFQNSLAGDLAFTALLFGGFAMLERMAPVVRGELRPA